MSKLIGDDIPYIIAAKDISKHIKESEIEVFDENFDVWVVTPSRMHTRETSRLNKQLGIHKINKFYKRMKT